MRRPVDDDEDRRAGWIWRFVRGGLVAVIASGAAVAVLSIFVLPPPQPPAPKAEPENTGPQMISGIEVSSQPAYSAAAGSDDGVAEGEAVAAVGGAGESAADNNVAAAAVGSAAGTAEPEDMLDLVELPGPALVVNAAAFEAGLDAPLVAVVLDDTAAVPLLHEALLSLPMPLTIGVVAGGGGDRETAAAARAAGFEVLAELPLGAPGQAGGALEYGLPEAEASVRTLTLMRRLPMAVAVAPPLAAQAPPNATVLRGIVAALAPLGFAYLDHGVAPGAESMAASVLSDLQVAAIFGVSRFTIGAGATATDAHTVLDRASAAAAREGTAVVVAAPSEELILALQLWGGGGSASLASPAPLSAVILRQQGGALDQLLEADPAPQATAPSPPASGGAADQTPPTSQ